MCKKQRLDMENDEATDLEIEADQASRDGDAAESESSDVEDATGMAATDVEGETACKSFPKLARTKADAVAEANMSDATEKKSKKEKKEKKEKKKDSKKHKNEKGTKNKKEKKESKGNGNSKTHGASKRKGGTAVDDKNEKVQLAKAAVGTRYLD